MRKLQIGVIGSVGDLNYPKAAEVFAKELGREIAKRGYTLVFGAEKDADSLPTVAARSAVRSGGTTLAVTYDKGLDVFDPDSATIVVATGMVRGGGRETSLMLSCDGVIALAGGSGTLNEICVAYQANIPVVVVDLFGGWAAKLAGEYLDERRRYRFEIAQTPEEAVEKINRRILGDE
jgi:uncharacterized protein (TIGR00725 family)